MSEAEGLSPRERGRRRRADVLEALIFAKKPLTTKQIAERTGHTYSQVYQDLRRMCGSYTLRYETYGAHSVCAGPEYPVIWHPWHYLDQRVTWEVNPEYLGPEVEPDPEAEEAAVRTIMRSFLAVV